MLHKPNIILKLMLQTATQTKYYFLNLCYNMLHKPNIINFKTYAKNFYGNKMLFFKLMLHKPNVTFKTYATQCYTCQMLFLKTYMLQNATRVKCYF